MEPGQRSYLLPLITLSILYLFGMPLWALTAVTLWYLALLWLEDVGKLDQYEISRVLGVVLMIRTNRGQRVLDMISRNRVFWRGFGEFSIWLCLLTMIVVVAVLIGGAIATIISPPENYLPAKDLLLIPGVNSFVPFWWPAIALIFALVIHEYSHGIQARAHGMRVRSFGLLLAGPIPIGAFAEPQQHEMIRAPLRERMRLYAAGPSINIIATYLALLLLSAAATGLVASSPGVYASGIIADEGAEEGGLLPYEIITHIDGVPISGYSDFTDEMSTLSAGDSAVFSVLSTPDSQGERVQREVEVTLGDRHDYYIDMCEGDSACIEDTEVVLAEIGIQQGDAFLGVSNVRSASTTVDMYSSIISSDRGLLENTLVTLVTPLGMLGQPIAYDGQTMLLEERGMLESRNGGIASALGTEGMLMLFDFLFWMVWINFLLGFFNLIPMIPFDGGHIVKDGVHSLISRVAKGMSPLRIESIASTVSSMSSFVALFVLMLTIILPRLV